MKRSIVFGVLFSTVMARGDTAQSWGRQTPSQPGSSEQVTVTGCLRSGAAAARDEFVLTNAKMGSVSPSGRSSAANTGATGSATESASSGATRYKLEGGRADLQKYANSQVEVSGTLEKTMGNDKSATGSATTGATGAAGPTGAGSAATGTAPVQGTPVLRVSSVRLVTKTCTGS